MIMLRIGAAASFCLVFSSCSYLSAFFEQEPEIDECDPAVNHYTPQGHYIERDFLKDDGTLDYQRYFESKKAGSSKCDPIKKNKEDVRNRELLKQAPPEPGPPEPAPAMRPDQSTHEPGPGN